MTLEGANTQPIDAAVRLSPRPEGANTESQIELEATVRPSPTLVRATRQKQQE
jgi:hypothetical protein